MVIKKFLVFLCLGSLIFIGCKDDENTKIDCTGLTPKYTSDISPIINTNCAIENCHGSIGTQAGINLSNYANVKSNSSKSDFLKSIKHESGVVAMPIEGSGLSKLSTEKIKLIECWIQNGQPE